MDVMEKFSVRGIVPSFAVTQRNAVSEMLLLEGRTSMNDHAQPSAATYPPSSEVVSRAHVDASKYEAMYAASVSDPDAFWAEQAERLEWMKRPTE
ncbi:MAG: acetyl-coenzyme A synthetase N-terminal domain-containing protein, partial [Sagittula sp.]|uniref:acetyl-coenzyme A synthetase N-terminal domain-containing protein n=1 Tax=Sagittula sp. TaxID=2038081 RepID=UPI004059F880